MAKTKYYAAALTDGKTGTFTDWNACKAFIATCPSGARYKSFATQAEADAFLAPAEPAVPGHDAPAAENTHFDAVAYTDGSFNAKTGIWGYGCVIELDSGETVELSGHGKKYADARNVAGEICGAIKAVERAIALGCKTVQIRHDYTGIAAWATGDWSCNQPLTRGYRDYMAKLSESIDVSFKHVKGHTGVRGNERADQLAGLACGAK